MPWCIVFFSPNPRSLLSLSFPFVLTCVIVIQHDKYSSAMKISASVSFVSLFLFAGWNLPTVAGDGKSILPGDKDGPLRGGSIHNNNNDYDLANKGKSDPVTSAFKETDEDRRDLADEDRRVLSSVVDTVADAVTAGDTTLSAAGRGSIHGGRDSVGHKRTSYDDSSSSHGGKKGSSSASRYEDDDKHPGGGGKKGGKKAGDDDDGKGKGRGKKAGGDDDDDGKGKGRGKKARGDDDDDGATGKKGRRKDDSVSYR